MIARRALLLLKLPLLALDCAGNVLCAFGRALWQLVAKAASRTLSATAWSVREHRVFGWTHRAIDTAFAPFGDEHCRLASEREEAGGGCWRVWWADWKAAGRSEEQR